MLQKISQKGARKIEYCCYKGIQDNMDKIPVRKKSKLLFYLWVVATVKIFFLVSLQYILKIVWYLGSSAQHKSGALHSSVISSRTWSTEDNRGLRSLQILLGQYRPWLIWHELRPADYRKMNHFSRKITSLRASTIVHVKCLKPNKN